MRLLLDAGLPRSAAAWLTARGCDTVHVGDVGLASASDAAIVDWARCQMRTVVTLDADFHALLALASASGPSVIRIREEGLRGPELASLIARTLAACRADLEAGALVTVRGSTVRLRRLPLRLRSR